MASGTIQMNSPMPTWIYEEKSTNSNTPTTYTYTVSGNGFIVANGYIRSDTTSDTGTATVGINHLPVGESTEYARAWTMSRFQTAQAMELGTNAAGSFKVSDGDTLMFNFNCTKNGSKRIRYSIMLFGCTLTAQ